MSTITDNVQAVLDHLGIRGVQFVFVAPDRIFCLDTLGDLEAHIHDHPEHWFKDTIDVLHEHIEGSWRERCRPSMQCCKRRISQINPNHTPYLYRWELDIDFSPTDSPVDFARHAWEVIDNALTHHTTDENKVSPMLAERFAKENDEQHA